MGHLVIGEGALKQLVGWLSINVKYLLFKRLLFKLGVAEPIGVKVSVGIISHLSRDNEDKRKARPSPFLHRRLKRGKA